MKRVLVNNPVLVVEALLSGVGDQPSPLPDSVAATVTASDGTVLMNAAAASSNGDGTYTLALTTSETEQLDTLTIDWAAGAAGTTRTVVEVVGGFHFTIAELRRLDPLADTAKYPTARLEQARTLAETAIEDACGTAFVPRYQAVTAYLRDGWAPNLPAPVTSIRSVTVDGTAWDSGQVTGLNVAGGHVYGPLLGWAAGSYRIGLEYGRDYCPPWVARASMLLARHILIDSPVDDRYTSVSTDVGTFSLITPGPGVMTAIPEVNSVIDQYRMPVV